MLAAMVLAIFTVFSAGSITHGFVSYYTASRLLVSGELGPLAYDDRWFGEVVQRADGEQHPRDLHSQPADDGADGVAARGARRATRRDVWLVASFSLFLAGVAALVRYQAHAQSRHAVPVLLLMLLSPAVFTNLRSGRAT